MGRELTNINRGKQAGVGHIIPGIDLVISEGLNALIEQAFGDHQVDAGDDVA